MKFRIGRWEYIHWPDKCVCCGDKPILKYPAVGKGYLVRKHKTSSVDAYESEQVVVEYPVCRKHYFWSLGMDIAYLVALCGIAYFLLGYVTALSFGYLSIEMLLLLPLFAVVILVIVLQPVRVRGARRAFYTVIIRNDDYAMEFAMLNNLSSL
jgi:hypothetical protein